METTAPWPFLGTGRPLEIVGADGAHLVTRDGRRILDAAGGAIVVNVGHGRREVARALAEAAERLTYAIPPWATPERTALVERLRRDWLPPELTRVHLTSGGSEAVESAIRIALTHHVARGEPTRTKIIAREPSYHGTTLATAAAGGHPGRKRGLEHVLAVHPRVAAPYPLRHPAGVGQAHTGAWYVEQLRATIEREGAHTIAAFLAEPITGSSGGALVPPDDYWPAVRALCDEHGILLILDEVMTGFGRTGKRFGAEHWSLVPDIAVGGKGLAGGYAAIAGVYARDRVVEPLRAGGLDVMFHTFAALPSACAAASAVLDILTREQLVERAAVMGEKLGRALTARLGQHPHVAEVRGRGLLWAVEVVADRGTLAPFPESARITSRIIGAGLERNVFFYPGGTGAVRDIVCLGPPLIVSDADIEQMAHVLAESIDAATRA